MPIDARKFYTCKHTLDYKIFSKNETRVSGSISTSYLAGSGTPYVSGDISSDQACVGYRVQITYKGTAFIGSPIMIDTEIQNYCNDGKIRQQATDDTGIYPNGNCCLEPYQSPMLKCCAFISCITCTWPVTCCCCHQCWLKSNKTTYHNKLEELGDNAMSKKIADLLKEADNMVDAQLKQKAYEQQQMMQKIQQSVYPAQSQATATPVPQGMVLMSPPQQWLPQQQATVQQFQQPAMQLAPVAVLNKPGTGSNPAPVLMYYQQPPQQQYHQVAPQYQQQPQYQQYQPVTPQYQQYQGQAQSNTGLQAYYPPSPQMPPKPSSAAKGEAIPLLATSMKRS